MPIPVLPCLSCIVPPATLCVSLPAGATLCANLPNSIVPSTSELARQMFAQVNSALAPLSPLFTMMDTIQALFDCVSALPKVISELNIVPLLECAPNLAEKISKLAAIFPPLSIPSTIRSILDTVLVFLTGLQQDLAGAQLQLDRILEASTAAQIPGNEPLLAIVNCAADFYGKIMEHTANSAQPLNRLLGVLNMLLSLVPGAPTIPCIGGLDGSPAILQGILEKFIAVLKIVRSLIPGGLVLTNYVPKGANC